MISILRPATVPPISSAAICAAITEPGPLPSLYWPLMSVMMPTRSTLSCARAPAAAKALMQMSRPAKRPRIFIGAIPASTP
jgi:hypothetical protein